MGLSKYKYTKKQPTPWYVHIRELFLAQCSVRYFVQLAYSLVILLLFY